MKPILLSCLLILMVSARSDAQDCPDIASYAGGREIIRDLARIVAPSGVQESFKTRIGGIDQWINVRGQDQSNPIIVFIHGGPASPLTPTLWQFQRPLEEYFTIVNWDQRGSGKTFREASADSIAGTVHIPRYVDDAIEVVEYIRQRYHKERVILMGHSWGTIIGMHAALKRPELFYAYVGIGQVINTRENERLSFEYAVAQAKQHNNSVATQELQSVAPYPGNQPITRARIIIARKWAQFYGGMSAFRESSEYFFKAPRLSPEYSAADICAIDQGNLFTLDKILPEFVSVDFNHVRKFPVPVVMFMGRHDYTTPSEPTALWLSRVTAPFKQGVWFEHSAHMMPWEEPGKTAISLVTIVRPLADPAARAAH